MDPDIVFQDIDITDVRHVEEPTLGSRKSIMIVTIADAQISLVDIEKMMEMGMNVAKLKTSHSTKSDKVDLIRRFDRAATFLAQKHNLLSWPCATAVELKTSVVQTGIIEEEALQLKIKTNTEVILTCDVSLFDKCNKSRIFVDDPYLTSDVELEMEINISEEEIILKCIAILDNKSVKCLVTKGGYLQNMSYVCMRGAKRTRPFISKKDLHLIKFAVEYQVDMIIINYARHVETIQKIKKFLGSHRKMPSIIIGISTQDGLMHLDDFIEESDGILLSREFLTYEVEPALSQRMCLIQKFICGKCRKAGKPFYISGGVLHEVLMTGNLEAREVSDVTNAILGGASGFALSEAPNIDYVIEAMKNLNDICASVEPLTTDRKEFWKLIAQIKMPVNAAEASAMSCVVVANETNARCIVIPTVTGRTAYLLNWLKPNSIVIAVSTRSKTVRLLKTYRSIIAVLYKGTTRKTWFETVQARVEFAIQFAVEKHLLDYGDRYITLEKGTEESSFCDAVRVWNVTQIKTNVIECPESYHDFELNCYATNKDIRSATRMIQQEKEKIELDKLKTMIARKMDKEIIELKETLKEETKKVKILEINKENKKDEAEEEGEKEAEKEEKEEEEEEEEEEEGDEEEEEEEEEKTETEEVAN